MVVDGDGGGFLLMPSFFYGRNANETQLRDVEMKKSRMAQCGSWSFETLVHQSLVEPKTMEAEADG